MHSVSDAPAPREWRFYIEDMRDFCEKVIVYADGLDRVSFSAQAMRYDAILRNLELIGEAATHVPPEVRSAWADIPWRMVIAVRNRLIHGYLGIDDDTLWSIVSDDVKPLRAERPAPDATGARAEGCGRRATPGALEPRHLALDR
jgi:uncharacterized protein with HEPN domain